ncbi:MAG TPA: aminoglycoside phosphotransferase family protein [candidate division Zixibacteria bacterium]|nr:aminoglycoside phosphotransferase family protein [candidate division Zixibacteria bacterium]
MPFKTEIKVTNKQISSIFSFHFPDEKIFSIKDKVESFVNPVFEVHLEDNTKYILKINNPQWSLKQRRELNAMEIVRENSQIPIPQVIGFNYSKTIIPYDYSIFEKIDGIELRELETKKQLHQNEYLSIIEELGYYVGLLHSISFDFFGDLLGSKMQTNFKPNEKLNYFWGKKFSSWKSCFKAICFDNLNWVDSKSFEKYRIKIIPKIDELAEKICLPFEACFIHSDIQPSNILIKDNKITSILDFEWAYAGSPSFEYELILAGLYLSNFPSVDKNSLLQSFPTTPNEDIESKFFSGYKKSFPHNIQREKENISDFIYLLYMIGSWDWTIKTSTPEEIEKYKLSIKETFERIF